MRDIIPGTIWAEGGEFKKIADASHLHNSYNYIRFRQEPGAVVWSHNAEENWIDDESLGVLVMITGKKRIRILPDAGV